MAQSTSPKPINIYRSITSSRSTGWMCATARRQKNSLLLVLSLPPTRTMKRGGTATFAESMPQLEQLAAEAEEERRSGLTEELDPSRL